MPTILLVFAIVLLLIYIYLSHRCFIKIYKKLENDCVSEQHMKKMAINLARVTLGERKKCELCRKDYI